MSTSGSTGDPRTGRDRRVPTKARTFKHGTVDPVIEHRRPLLTWGNAILVAIMIGFGLYATGNLPQLDAFFDHLNEIGRAHNNVVVGTLITYGSYLFGAVILAVFALFLFLFINTRRRRLSDPKGWHKVVDAPPDRRHRDRRTEDLPSLIMPLGKERPSRRATDGRPAVAPVTAKADSTTPATTPVPNSARAEALAAAAKAEAAMDAASPDLPSFVMPAGKAIRTAQPATPAEPAKVLAVQDNAPATVPAAAEKADAAALAAAATAAAAKLEAAMSAAKAAAAKAEAAIAAAKAEAAVAEAAMAAAKAEAAAATTN